LHIHPHVDINLIFNTPKKETKKQIQNLQISKDLHSTKEGFKIKNWFLDFSFFSSIRRTLLKTLNLYYCE